jgi:hypothetical protein
MGLGTLAYDLGVLQLSCYKTEMPKIIEQWLLFKYVNGEFTPLSKPFKTKAAAEKARQKYPERERGAIGVGVIRLKKVIAVRLVTTYSPCRRIISEMTHPTFP